MKRSWNAFTSLRLVISLIITKDVLIERNENPYTKCNTHTPGCSNVCFNYISPMSQIRFWTGWRQYNFTLEILFIFYWPYVKVQIIFTCAPTLCFLLWAMNSVHCMNNLVELMIETDGLPDIRKVFITSFYSLTVVSGHRWNFEKT